MVELGAGQKASPAFAEVVGQAQLKQALLAVAADGGLDGLLIEGEKGTAKSTTVRALADLLPGQRAVADCPYGCPPDDPARQCEDCRERTDPPVECRSVPLVTLPLGATRERVVGSLSVADALDGDFEFDPGLLARANRGILYVDEVNLLEDHLVDVVLDAAASGVNRVERDSVSVTHPAEFTLIGTMNPEEGQLRPQLRDRFALQATVTGCEAVEDRVAIIEQALDETEAGDTDDTAVRERLLDARELLPEVSLPEEYLTEIAELCREAGVDGHRGDIATARAARVLAALDGRGRVIETDLRRAADLALSHRLQSTPFEDAPDPEEVVDEHFDGEPDDEPADGDGSAGETDPDTPGADDGQSTDDGSPESDAEDGPNPNESDDDTTADHSPDDGNEGGDRPEPTPTEAAEGGDTAGADRGDGDANGDGDEANEESEADGDDADGEGSDGDRETGTPLLPGQARAGVGESAAPDLDAPAVGSDADGTDRGSRAEVAPGPDRSGPRVRTERADGEGGVDAAASARAAASRGAGRVESRDLRRSVRAGEASALVVFAVDASASMRPAMRAAKGTVLELLREAYRGRDEVAVVAFAGEDAEVLLPPTDSVTLAARHLKELPTGDRTPLPAGLETAATVLDRADPDAATVVCVTDGRSNAADSPVAATREAARALAAREPHVLVVDAGDGRGLTDLLVAETDGERVPLDALSAERVDATL